MVVPPSSEDEDARRLSREREILLDERIRQANRVKASEATTRCGATTASVLRRWRPATAGHCPARLKAEILRALDRLELLLRQMREVEAAREEFLRHQPDSTAAMLRRIYGVGRESAAVLRLEGFYRRFANRRAVAAYAGLAPTPLAGSITTRGARRRETRVFAR
jgi:transposase